MPSTAFFEMVLSTLCKVSFAESTADLRAGATVLKSLACFAMVWRNILLVVFRFITDDLFERRGVE